MNVFTSREKRLIPNDLRVVEQKLSIQLPLELKEHYLQLNGGIPSHFVWFDLIGKTEPVEIQKFLPVRYCRKQGDNPAFTLEGIAAAQWASQQLPRHYLPFALDFANNYICVERASGSVCHVDRARWRADLSPQENWVATTRHLARSFDNFVLNLQLPARQATVPEPPPMTAVELPAENVFRHCERPMMDWDFALVEATLSLRLPDAFKSHYRRYNGGVPDHARWLDPTGSISKLEVAHFLPLLPPPGQGDGAMLTVLGAAEHGWETGRLPRKLLAFASDRGGKHLCLDRIDSQVFLVDAISALDGSMIQLAKREPARPLLVASSFQEFLDGLQA